MRAYRAVVAPPARSAHADTEDVANSDRPDRARSDRRLLALLDVRSEPEMEVRQPLHVALLERDPPIGRTVALDVVAAGTLSDSEAVRTALREAADRRRARSAIRLEVRRLASDDIDRAEMQLIRTQMAEFAPSAVA